jgi:hypothetical protein
MDDMTNKTLGRFVTAEMIVMLSTLLVGGSLAWGQVTSKVDMLTTTVTSESVKRESLEAKFIETDKKLERIESNQRYVKVRLTEQSGEIKEQRLDIKDILKILRER